MIKEQVPQLSAHANDPPRDKLPAEPQRMRTWSYAQVKMHISNDNPVEAEELGMLRAQRTRTAPVTTFEQHDISAIFYRESVPS